ncbi:hypothetical protein ACFL2H_04135 [Planctomycetota bacterium]
MTDRNSIEKPKSTTGGPADHIIALAVIASGSFVLGLLLTPADPISMVTGIFFCFGALIPVYLWGVRNGRRSRK